MSKELFDVINENKIFIAIDTGSQKKANSIIKQSKKKFKVGYKFGLEFINLNLGEILYQN